MSEISEMDSSGLIEESTTPLYYQLLSLLKADIYSGVLKEGDLVPSERLLCEKYKVSRSTVRQALNQLTEENLIIRRRGKGSFIASQKLRRNLNHLYSFTEDILSMNRNPHSKILDSKLIEAPAEVAKSLHLPERQIQVYLLSRLRLVDKEPILVETTYIPIYLCPDVSKEDFSSQSLYSVLRNRYDLNLYKAIETIEAITLDQKKADLLGCEVSSPGFSIRRIAYLDNGVAFEYTSSVTRGDKCTFEVELFAQKNKVYFSRKVQLKQRSK